MFESITICLSVVIGAQSGAMPLKAESVGLACQMAPELIKRASEAEIEPSVFAALIYVESRWEPKAVSSAGACGLTQVIPKYSKFRCRDLKNPSTSLLAGSVALKSWRRYAERTRGGRSISRVLACYNAGVKCLKSKKGAAYARAVLKYSRMLGAGTVRR